MSSSDLRARMDGLEVLGKADAVYPEPLSRHNRAPFAQQVNKLGYKRETATNVLKQAQKVPTILYRKWGCVSHFFVLLPHCMELANPDTPNHLQKKVTAHPIWTIQKICKNLEKMPSLPQTEPSCCPLPHVQKRKLFTIFVIDETIRLIQISWKNKIVVLPFYIETEPLEFFIILMLETIVFLYNLYSTHIEKRLKTSFARGAFAAGTLSAARTCTRGR